MGDKRAANERLGQEDTTYNGGSSHGVKQLIQ